LVYAGAAMGGHPMAAWHGRDEQKRWLGRCRVAIENSENFKESLYETSN
jgi:hypothetical protein